MVKVEELGRSSSKFSSTVRSRSSSISSSKISCRKSIDDTIP